MKSSTTYDKLKQKYEHFRAPTARVKVEGTEIIEQKSARLVELTVDLTSGYEASGCRLTLFGEYDRESASFSSSGPAPLLQIGAKVEIELGYIKTEIVFCGLITGVTYLFDAENEPMIEVECMDAKCLLMKTQRLEIRSEKKISSVVKALLSEQPVSQYISEKEVDDFGAEDAVIPTALESDYQFLADQAQYYGHEFFIMQGKCYFRIPPASSSPIMTIDAGKMVHQFRLALQGGGLLKKVTVKGIDREKAEQVSGSSSVEGSFSTGSTARRMIGNTEKVVFDPLISTAGEAAARAAKMAGAVSSGFGTIECRCFGIPELVPGRTVTFQGLTAAANKTARICKVRHIYNQGGFTTTLEAEVDSL